MSDTNTSAIYIINIHSLPLYNYVYRYVHCTYAHVLYTVYVCAAYVNLRNTDYINYICISTVYTHIHVVIITFFTVHLAF